MRTLPETTIERIHQLCRKHSAELIEYTLRGQPHALILELFIDSVEGVTHALCEAISRDLEPLFEADPALADVVCLDVSSPGVDRPLQFEWQYPKHLGRKFSVYTHDGAQYRGRLRSTSSHAIELECAGQTVTIPFSAIARANVEIDW